MTKSFNVTNLSNLKRINFFLLSRLFCQSTQVTSSLLKLQDAGTRTKLFRACMCKNVC
jgi:hypothetical protein